MGRQVLAPWVHLTHRVVTGNQREGRGGRGREGGGRYSSRLLWWGFTILPGMVTERHEVLLDIPLIES